MSKKKIIIIISITTLAILGGYLFIKLNTKEAYNYSDYYVFKDNKKINEVKDPDNLKENLDVELSLDLLKKTNGDIAGILELDDRLIYEPIVQAPDNDYYVRKNIEQRYSAAGIPFISSDGNLGSRNVVVYGHSSKRNVIIFTFLMNYIDSTFYYAHPTYRFITENGTRTYRIFAVLNIDLKNLDDSLEFTQSEWRSDKDFTDFLDNSISTSLYKTNVSVNKDDKLMALVTCDTRDNNKRIVILAKLESNNE